MQTGIISFGDRVAWNIKCNKDAILDELSFNIEQLGYVKSWLTSVDIKLDKIGTL